MASDEAPRSPLELFPIEVWEKIFTYLKGRDLFSCYRTAEAWRQELEKQKSQFLMSEVFPQISHLLDRSQVLNTRLVCGSWKDAVEDYLQNHPSHFNVVRSDEIVNLGVQGSRNDYIPRNLNFGWIFEAWRDADFLTTVPEGCNNPFLTRSVWYFDMTFYLEGRAVLTQILERFGTQVWHFHLTIGIEEEGPTSNAETLYRLSRSWLLLMPNLKSLILQFCVKSGYWIDKSEYLMTPAKEELIRNHPLPPLIHLITLKLFGVINPLQYAVLQRYNHVQKMSLEKDSWGWQISPLFKDALGAVHMDRLEELHTSPESGEDFRKLQSACLNTPWPLRVLSMDIGGLDDERWELLFDGISHFGGTLRHLGIRLRLSHFSKLKMSEVFVGKSLDLPHLETLKLMKSSSSDEDFISSLNFLQPCVSLKILELSIIGKFTTSSLAPLLSFPLRALRLGMLEDKDLGVLLGTVSQLGATLRHLEINGQQFLLHIYENTPGYVSSNHLLTPPTLALPHLETLKISCGRLVVDSLDFIQECTSLRNLSLAALYTQRIPLNEDHTVIQFHGHFLKMNESNIWRSLPDLEVFELKMKGNARASVGSYGQDETGFVECWRVNRIYSRAGYTDVEDDYYW